jgi:sulfite reductase beta subunit-like hemoprotein
MVRIKVPGGLLPVAGARRIAHVARRFATGGAHVTTSRDMQIHHVDLNATASLMEALHAVGLTTADSAGNGNTNTLDGLAEHFARDGLHTTREQNIAILGIEPALAEDVVDAVSSLGMAVEGTIADPTSSGQAVAAAE